MKLNKFYIRYFPPGKFNIKNNVFNIIDYIIN